MENKRILVIESDPDFATELSQILSSMQLSVTLEAEGQAGINQVTNLNPDLIVLAAELPGMSGYSVCNRIKETKKTNIFRS